MNFKQDLMAGRMMHLSRDKESCERLARHLEIQADGGDNPAEFVSYALQAASDEIALDEAHAEVDRLTNTRPATSYWPFGGRAKRTGGNS